MKWSNRVGRVWTTINGTTKARAYYWIRQEINGRYIAGYYGFGRDIQYQNISFESLGEAKTYCKRLDDSAVVIEAINA